MQVFVPDLGDFPPEFACIAQGISFYNRGRDFKKKKGECQKIFIETNYHKHFRIVIIQFYKSVRSICEESTAGSSSSVEKSRRET